MKNKFLKFTLPVLVVVLAVTSAFTTIANADELRLTVGYEQNPNAQNCAERTQTCSPVVTPTFCRVGQIASNPRLWDKNASDECNIPLYKP